MGLLSKYKFTNKRHPAIAVMAVILALIGIAALVLVIVSTYKNGGVALPRYGMTVILALLMSLVGLILAIVSRTKPDRYYFFSDLGILLNSLLLLCCGGILLLGLS